MRVAVAALLLAGFIACGDTPPPEPPPTTTIPTPPPGPTIPPRHTRPFTWNLARGFSLFSGASATDEEVVQVFTAFKTEWTNLWPTARMCGERMRWPDRHEYLYKGPTAAPYDATSPAFVEVKHFLDWAASVPHAQVLLVPICTLKEDWSMANIENGEAYRVNEKWVRTMCRLASDYENVAIEVINEWKHPNSIYTMNGTRDRQDQVIRMIRACREEAPRTQIGTDSNVNQRNKRYDPTIEPVVDYLSFHPWRNPDPDEDEMREMVRQRIGAAVFSETTCYDQKDNRPNPTGNCTGIQDQILVYQRDAERKGAVYTYHPKYLGLCWPRADCKQIGWVTPRGDHPIKHGL